MDHKAWGKIRCAIFSMLKLLFSCVKYISNQYSKSSAAKIIFTVCIEQLWYITLFRYDLRSILSDFLGCNLSALWAAVSFS